jgi:hypothetical protein
MTTQLHPWLSSPEATQAARKGVQIPLALLPSLANRAGTDKLETQALAILAECALPPRDQAPSATAQVQPAYVGSMHFWPEDDRQRYAAREIGYALMNWLRTNHSTL